MTDGRLGDSTHDQFRLLRHADLAHQHQIQRAARLSATSLATSTPPRGRARMTGRSFLRDARAARAAGPLLPIAKGHRLSRTAAPHLSGSCSSSVSSSTIRAAVTGT